MAELGNFDDRIAVCQYVVHEMDPFHKVKILLMFAEILMRELHQSNDVGRIAGRTKLTWNYPNSQQRIAIRSRWNWN